MGVLVRYYDDVYVECDMDYGRYVRDGVNYVPCAMKGRDLDKVLPILRDYLSRREIFREIRIDTVDGGLSLEIPTITLSRGRSVGEILDSLVYLLIGIRHCTTYLSNTK